MKAYKLAEWTVEPETNQLTRGDASTKLESRVMQMLVYLYENPNRVISRSELMEAVWGPTSVSDNSVSVAIRALRQALGDDAQNPRFIETHQKLGYRLLVKSEILEAQDDSSRPPRYGVVAGLVLGALIIAVATGSRRETRSNRRSGWPRSLWIGSKTPRASNLTMSSR